MNEQEQKQDESAQRAVGSNVGLGFAVCSIRGWRGKALVLCKHPEIPETYVVFIGGDEYDVHSSDVAFVP